MTSPEKPAGAGERLAKIMSRNGLCSRRQAETWIAAGRVSVNGAIVRTPAFNVTEKDAIAVDGQPLAKRQATRLWLYHKPEGLVVTESDPEGRPTIFEALEDKGLPRVMTIGRLDINTEGLLILTNDGGLKRVLELPATGWLRRYRVRAFGSVTQAQLDTLKSGLTLDGVKYGPIDAQLEREQGSNVWLIVALREGKNREVKNVLASLGLQVNRLIRISYGPFQLGDIPIGAVESVRTKVLRDQLGPRLAEAAGVDFDTPVAEAEPRRAPERERGVITRRPAPRRGPRDEDDKKKSFGDRPPRRDDGDRKPYGEKKSFGDRPPRRDDGDRKPYGEKKSFGDRPPRRDDGDRKPFGEKKSFGDRPPRRDDGDRKPFGEKKSFGDRPPRRDDGDRKPYGEKKSFGDRPPRRDDGDRKPFGEKKSFGDRPPRRDDGPRKPYGEKKSFGDRPPRRDGEAPARKVFFPDGRDAETFVPREEPQGRGKPGGGKPGGRGGDGKRPAPGGRSGGPRGPRKER